jgi:energy-coupling factor transporter ATP-binding protein EcfA2
MQHSEESSRIISVHFENYKALVDFRIRLKETNILVGPNNAGKSTIIGAFRALAVALRRLSGKKPDVVNGPNGRRYGVVVPPESLPISIENIHTDYIEKDTVVTFGLSNSNSLQLFFPRDGSCKLIAECHNRPLLTSSAFRREFPLKISVVPVLGPVEHQEELVQPETVERNLHTHRASRNFRSYWYHFPEEFAAFSQMVHKTWPGSEIELPTMTDYVNRTLTMFCLENRIPRELFWIGSGFQIWCQLLTHLILARNSSLVVIDEPEVYLHADLQRQLIGILRNFKADVLVATHSTEIMGEAEPADLVLVDKKNRTADRIKNVERLQSALESVGSIHNITLSRIARSRRILFIEGDFDYKLIRMIARQLGFDALASGLEIVPALSGGFGSWQKVSSLGWGIERALGDQIAVSAVYDRDYFCEEEIEAVEKELDSSPSFAHVHRRKEIENYLLLPPCIDRAIQSAVKDRCKREQAPYSQPKSIVEELVTITEKYKEGTFSQRIGHEIDYKRRLGTKADSATLHARASAQLNASWKTLEKRLEIVSGKAVLADVRSLVGNQYGISLPDSRIISTISEEDIPDDFRKLLEKLEVFRSAAITA